MDSSHQNISRVQARRRDSQREREVMLDNYHIFSHFKNDFLQILLLINERIIIKDAMVVNCHNS